MMLAVTLVSTSLLLWQAVEDVYPPRINFEPNQNVLIAILSLPSAKVNRLEPATGRDDVGHVFQIGPGITPPRIRTKSDPDFSQKGKVKHMGTVVIRALVGSDGRVHDVRVVRRMGWGLDEKAVEAVKQWVFDPATKDGHEIAVYIDVEISFRLY